MWVSALLLSLVALGLFYLQNLLLYPHVQVRWLSLLTFAAARQQPLPVAVALAVWVGLLKDAYALTPMGLHLGGALLLVAAARFLGRRLLLAAPLSQILASFLLLLLEEIFLGLVLGFMSLPPLPRAGLFRPLLLETVATALLAPLVFAGMVRFDRFLMRLGCRAWREQW